MELNMQATDGGANPNYKPLNAPKLTPADIEAVIVNERYFTAAEGLAGREVAPLVNDLVVEPTLNHVTFCILTLRNGAKVTGANHGPVSAANFDAQMGRDYARRNAIEKVWELEGYLLRDRLSRGDINQHADEQERARRDLLLALCEKLGCEIDQLLWLAGPGGFGWAINQIKMGKKVARRGWNGAGMFAYLVPAASYPAQTGAAKAHFGENAPVPYRAYLALKTAQGDVATWAPSCSDTLAEDWVVVE